MPPVTTWGELCSARPDLGEAGRNLYYQFGVGLGFLATTAPDGGPRVHPICPVITDDELYAFIVRSPKRDDLQRDGRFALHSFPCPDNEDAFYVTGTAQVVDDAAVRASLTRQFLDERPQLGLVQSDIDDQTLFRFDVARALMTRTVGHGDPDPRHTVWRAQV
jgi:Pyridoxamine 5'-phosphate oxidase